MSGAGSSCGKSSWAGLLVAALVLVNFAASESLAQKSPEKKPARGEVSPAKASREKESAGKPAKDGQDDSRSSGADLSDEDATLAFAKKHHPELAVLLTQLRESRAREYKAALADVNRTRERLERAAERQPERYPLELAEWQVNSRIRLLVARLAMSDDPALEAELRTALKERQAIRMQLLQEEQERLSERLARVEKLIRQQTDQEQEIVERDFAALRQAAAAASKSSRNKELRDATSGSKQTRPKPDASGSGSRQPDPARSDTKIPGKSGGTKTKD